MIVTGIYKCLINVDLSVDLLMWQTHMAKWTLDPLKWQAACWSRQVTLPSSLGHGILCFLMENQDQPLLKNQAFYL